MDTDNAIEIGKRIRNRRIELNITQEELGQAVGMNKSTVQRYETGQVKKIKLPVLETIARKLNVHPEWLALQSDVMEEEKEPQDDLSTLMQKYDNIRPVKLKKFPLLGEIACGEPIFADEDRESFIMADMDIRADFCLRAKGDSMINARIYDGDVVFIRKMPIVDNGEIAAVIIDDEATLKRVYYYPENNMIQLVAENPKYNPLVYQNEELNYIRILGKAVYFMSAL